MGHRRAIRQLLGLVLACVGALHLLRGDLTPQAHRLSEYANGSWGWLMTTAFVGLGAALAFLGLDLWRVQPRSPSRRATAVAAMAGGLGALASAAYPTGRSDGAEAVHSSASTITALAVVVVALVLARRGTAATAMARRLAWAGPPLLVASVVLHDTGLRGLGQRGLWVVLLASLLLAADRLTAAPPTPHSDGASPEGGDGVGDRGATAAPGGQRHDSRADDDAAHG